MAEKYFLALAICFLAPATSKLASAKVFLTAENIQLASPTVKFALAKINESVANSFS